MMKPEGVLCASESGYIEYAQQHSYTHQLEKISGLLKKHGFDPGLREGTK